MKKIILCSLFILLPACGGTSLTDQFQQNINAQTGAVQILALHHLRDGTAGDLTAEGFKVITNELGYEITLKKALIHFHALNLISEGADLDCVPGFDTNLDLHATQDLLTEDLFTHLLNTSLVPKAFFCQFELMLGSGPEDHHGIKFAHPEEGGEGDPGHGTGEEISGAFQLEGSWSHGADSGDFLLHGDDSILVTGLFKTQENEEVIEHPLHFHEGEDVITVIFGVKYNQALDGVDFKNQSHDEQILQIYQNLETAVHQHTGDHHGSSGSPGHGHN